MAVGSFSAGLSGLNANGTYLSVIGNNLANIDTIGFKSSSDVQDLVSQTVGGASANPMQVGLGVTTGAISPVFSQGAIENTREATNVAIQGGGFFVVADDDGSYAYTRAGNFTFDKDGKLVTPDGHFVQGYIGIDPATGAVITSGQPGDILVIFVPPASRRGLPSRHTHAPGDCRRHSVEHDAKGARAVRERTPGSSGTDEGRRGRVARSDRISDA